MCTEKELPFFQEIEHILYVTEAKQFTKFEDAFFKVIAKCVSNPNRHVAQRAPYVWKNDYMLSLIEKNNQTVIPLMFPALHRAPRSTGTRQQWHCSATR
ncbi:hypothetical protein HPB48_012017 [Haemaphysalis longicornis]|uniref:Uncharacterized protein n=1 Tax=Haemaphysalis longicornis TaxID=44386 RepID=A0A9J6G932_HAELO|nr:hypothetical protein HPB48_012017 [Haemaphysalis longicornis]